MRTRLEFSAVLNAISGPKKVYFQKPSNVSMKYPCIVYNIDNLSSLYADDIKYKNMTRYTVTVIDENPDSTIYKELLKLNYSNLDRMYVSDQLHHFVLTIYY
jgi:hypothetical protein